MGENSHTQNSNLAGEFAVLSQLAMRGLIANLTLGNAKKVDILVLNPKTNKMFRIEVKTRLKQSIPNSKYFEDNMPHYSWPHMNEKHEELIENNLYYIFVEIKNENTQPKFFIVPSKDVAEYLKWENDKYWEKPHKNKKTGMLRSKEDLGPKDNKKRTFRINPETNTNEKFPQKNYLNNFDIFKEN